MITKWEIDNLTKELISIAVSLRILVGIGAAIVGLLFSIWLALR